MKKLVLGCFVAIASVVFTSTISAMSVKAETIGENRVTGEYIDSTSPQVIERIVDNIVTFRDVNRKSNNYYVPDWMFSKYDLKVGSSMHLYNRNVIQGVFRDTYIDVVSQGIPENISAFMISETRRFCTLNQSPASEGLGRGRRVWYKSVCCPSTIPVVGAMWFYQRREITALEPSIPRVLPTPAPYVAPIMNEKPTPVQGLW